MRFDPAHHDPVTIYRALIAREIPRVAHGMWRHPPAARAVIEHVLRCEGHALDNAPGVCNSPWFIRHRLEGILAAYQRSPYLTLTSLWPGRWRPIQFRELPRSSRIQPHALAAENISPGTRSAVRAGWLRTQRARDRHVCLWCGRTLPPGHTSLRCPACQEERGARDRAERQRRIDAGLCTYPGCPDPSVPGQRLCPKHREQFRRYPRKRRA